MYSSDSGTEMSIEEQTFASEDDKLEDYYEDEETFTSEDDDELEDYYEDEEQMNMDYGSESAENSANSDDFSEPEELNAGYILRWIRNEQFVYLENEPVEYIEYPELDFEDIAERASDTELNKVIEELLKEDIENKDTANFANIKSLVEAAELQIEDTDLLDKCFLQAIQDEDNKAVKFYLAMGANRNKGIIEAIEVDSLEMLALLEVEPTTKFLTLAIKHQAYESLNYFLQYDFEASYNIILSAAIKTRNTKLLEVVCSNAELEQTYDLIRYLIKEDGIELISEFVSYFDLTDLLAELQEQDGNQGFYDLVLDHLKEKIPSLKLADYELANFNKLFKKKLQIRKDLLIYPEENFKGDASLKELRSTLVNLTRLSEEAKSAANFIGINLSTTNRYFTSHPYHPSDFKKSEKYFRSAEHPLSIFVGPDKARYKPNAQLPEANAKNGMGNEAHLGLYKVPLDSLNDSKAIEKTKKAGGHPLNACYTNLYDQSLKYRGKICSAIVKKFPVTSSDAIKVGFYYSYPCLLVYLKKPSWAADVTNKGPIKAWTEVVISYFVGLVNYTAHQHGLDVELVRRSSFGFLTPTIAPCEQSFRINVGIVPTYYTEVLLTCLQTLNAVLSKLNQSFSKLKALGLSMDLPPHCFIRSSNYPTYLGEKTVPKVKNVLELAWAKVDKGGKTGAFNLMRTPAGRDGLTAQVYNALKGASPTEIMNYSQIFVDALRWGFNKISVNGKTLNFDQTEAVIFKKVKKQHAQIKDKAFFKFIKIILKSVRFELLLNELPPGLLKNSFNETIKVIVHAIKNETLENLYFRLEVLNELLFSKTIFNHPGEVKNCFGSDSEVDNKYRKLKQDFFGKKLIVRNGMRAILAALHSGACYLHPNYLTQEAKPTLVLRGAYYETADAMKLLNKFNIIKPATQSTEAEILLYDTNACVTTGQDLPKLPKQILSSIKVLIIDSTSASIEKYNYWFKMFQKYPNIQVLFFASSGFKNEQLGADKNPYGTLRVFTKDEQVQSKIIEFIKKTEAPINSSISHHYRHLMKRLGHIPTNHSIAFFAPPKIPIEEDRDLNSKMAQLNSIGGNKN